MPNLHKPRCMHGGPQAQNAPLSSNPLHCTHVPFHFKPPQKATLHGTSIFKNFTKKKKQNHIVATFLQMETKRKKNLKTFFLLFGKNDLQQEKHQNNASFLELVRSVRRKGSWTCVSVDAKKHLSKVF